MTIGVHFFASLVFGVEKGSKQILKVFLLDAKAFVIYLNFEQVALMQVV